MGYLLRAPSPSSSVASTMYCFLKDFKSRLIGSSTLADQSWQDDKLLLLPAALGHISLFSCWTTVKVWVLFFRHLLPVILGRGLLCLRLMFKLLCFGLNTITRDLVILSYTFYLSADRIIQRNLDESVFNCSWFLLLRVLIFQYSKIVAGSAIRLELWFNILLKVNKLFIKLIQYPFWIQIG